MADTDRVPAAARVFVLVLIGALLYFGWNAIEKWPFTGWRLYSNTKGPTAGTFVAYRVGPSGAEHEIDYHDLPYSYQRAPYVLNKFPHSSAATRESVCDGLAHGERDAGRPVQAIRVYWELRRVVPVNGERHTRLVERELRYTCARSSA